MPTTKKPAPPSNDVVPVDGEADHGAGTKHRAMLVSKVVPKDAIQRMSEKRVHLY
jgi:hypothetical protein